MAEYRLAKVATELNRSFQALADLLNQQGFDVMPKPTTKITEDMYQALLREFSADKAAKDEAKLLKNNRDPKPATAPPVAAKPTVVEVLAKLETKAPAPAPEPATQEKVAVKAEELAGPKILGKIEIGKKKTAEAPVAKTEAPAKDVITEPIVETKSKEEVTAVETPVEPAVVEKTSPKTELPVVSEAVDADEEEVEKIDTKFETLSGPKVLGKINLPTVAPTGVKSLAGEARDELREKRKRKRKQAGTEKVAVQERVQIAARTNTTDPNRSAPKVEITKEAVQQKVRNTMGQMGNAGKTRGMKQKIKARNKEERANDRRETNLRKEKESKILKVTEFLTANELATMMNINVTQVISTCFLLGIVVSINQRLDAETIQLVSDNFGFEVEFVDAESQIEAADNELDNEEDLLPRAPIVTVMGHVDHGKTSLLDYIRKANVIAGEAGGITQHIGAYEVSLPDGKKITFLDTPGHEAFTAMRARGAKVTDMAIIVIAADDSVMPQTREAIAHAQAANIPMVFAFNKIDKEGANADKIREQLSAMNILVEDWGGKFQCQEISAKKGQIGRAHV